MSGPSPGGDCPVVDGFTDFALIGSGGFSSVWSATELAFGRRVAVKVIEASASTSRRIRREAQALGALAGIPHVIQPYAISVTADGRPAMVMPLMTSSLAGHLGQTDQDTALLWADQIAGALDQAHAVGVFHRDIKPENVLVDSAGAVHLADFGISSVRGLDAATVTVMSLSPPHAPPERFTDDEVDPAAGDRYSLASTIFAVLTGAPAFGTTREGGPIGLMTRITRDPLPRDGRIADELVDVFVHAMAKDPRDRFPSAAAFLEALRSGIAAIAARTQRPPPGGEVDDGDFTIRVSPDEPRADAQWGKWWSDPT